MPISDICAVALYAVRFPMRRSPLGATRGRLLFLSRHTAFVTCAVTLVLLMALRWPANVPLGEMSPGGDFSRRRTSSTRNERAAKIMLPEDAERRLSGRLLRKKKKKSATTSTTKLPDYASSLSKNENDFIIQVAAPTITTSKKESHKNSSFSVKAAAIVNQSALVKSKKGIQYRPGRTAAHTDASQILRMSPAAGIIPTKQEDTLECDFIDIGNATSYFHVVKAECLLRAIDNATLQRAAIQELKDRAIRALEKADSQQAARFKVPGLIRRGAMERARREFNWVRHAGEGLSVPGYPERSSKPNDLFTWDNHRFDEPLDAVWNEVLAEHLDNYGLQGNECLSSDVTQAHIQDFLEMFAFWQSLVDVLQIPHSLLYGTLLGYFRNKGAIPFDKDIDVAVPSWAFNRLRHFAHLGLPTPGPALKLNPDFSKPTDARRYFNCYDQAVPGWRDMCGHQVLMGRVFYKSVYMDIYATDHLVELGLVIMRREVFDLAPPHLVFPTRRCNLMGIETRCPNNPIVIIREMYGRPERKRLADLSQVRLSDVHQFQGIPFHRLSPEQQLVLVKENIAALRPDYVCKDKQFVKLESVPDFYNTTYWRELDEKITNDLVELVYPDVQEAKEGSDKTREVNAPDGIFPFEIGRSSLCQFPNSGPLADCQAVR